MVVTRLFATAEIGVMQERTGSPSTCTVQAPHRAMPQPNLVPVSPRWSRSVHSSGVSAGRSTFCVRPLMVTGVIAILLSRRGSRGPVPPTRPAALLLHREHQMTPPCGTSVLVPRAVSRDSCIRCASTPQPDGTAMSCTPSTANELGTPEMPELVRHCRPSVRAPLVHENFPDTALAPERSLGRA